MAWERRRDSNNRYYYRSERLPDGRVHKTYVGTGVYAALAADADAAQRAAQQLELRRHRALVEYIHRVATPLVELCETCDVITGAALLTAGYHKPRGEWRKNSHGWPNSNAG